MKQKSLQCSGTFILLEYCTWMRLRIILTGSQKDIEKVLQGDKESLRILLQNEQYKVEGMHTPQAFPSVTIIMTITLLLLNMKLNLNL